MNELRRGSIFLVIFILVFSNLATYYYACQLAVPEGDAAGLLEMTDVAADNNRAFKEVWNILMDNYIDPLDEEELMRGAIQGMLETLDDPQTSFYCPEAMEDLMIQTTGSFSGIGVEITDVEGDILIVRVIEGTPAESAGLLPGDRIIKADNKSLAGLSAEEAARLLRGPRDTEVEIEVLRMGMEEPLSFIIAREDINMDTVFAELKEGKIGYIEITKFDRGTAESFQQELEALERNNLQGLVIDLRNNPGGLLDEAIEVGKVIVPAGEITRVVNRDGEVLRTYYSEAEPRSYPVAVLVNGFSASAAEIIAGALQDRKGAILVGESTYGKATVQHLEYLSDGSGLRYTIAKYQTPGGRDLHQQGLTPDAVVELTEEYYRFYQPIPSQLEPGDATEEAAILQKMLSLLGYDLEVTGVYDNETVKVVEKFQNDNGIPPTGLLDALTRNKLRQTLKEASTRFDTQLETAIKLLRDE